MDRIGFISDIHACEDSLLAVLKDIATHGIERIFCLGDIIGYGPDPLSCVDKIRAVSFVAVLGNHDAMALNRDIPLDGMPDEISLPLLHAREELGPDQIAWLRELPMTARGPGFEICHGSLDKHSRFSHLQGQREVERHFNSQREPLSFFGHTHVPSIFHRTPRGKIRFAKGIGRLALTEPGSYAVGVGSVGFPRDDDQRSCWVEFDPGSLTVEFHRLEVDRRQRDERLAALLSSGSKADG